MKANEHVTSRTEIYGAATFIGLTFDAQTLLKPIYEVRI